MSTMFACAITHLATETCHHLFAEPREYAPMTTVETFAGSAPEVQKCMPSFREGALCSGVRGHVRS